MGDISFRDEEYICPNINNPWEWVPVNYEGEDKYKLRSDRKSVGRERVC